VVWLTSEKGMVMNWLWLRRIQLSLNTGMKQLGLLMTQLIELVPVLQFCRLHLAGNFVTFLL
jgi:hypothetical protein